jgi:alpha-L-fucosidase
MMEPKKLYQTLSPVVFCIVVLIQIAGCREKEIKIYEPTWESLQTHPVPQWFTSAKLGIFIHWGVYAIPGDNEWYVARMSPMARPGRNPAGPPYTAAQGDLPDSVFYANIRLKTNQDHREIWGIDFAYDDFIPMFKAENFDPGAWANLFEEAGAKYVVMTAKHGDEFAMWPSRYTSRNAVEMGPHRDLLGDLTQEVRSHGLKMGVYYNTTYSFWDVRFPDKEWVEYQNNSIKELVDLYKPDILWGDVYVGTVRDDEENLYPADHWKSKEVIAYFYNNSVNPDEVVTNERWGIDTTSAGINSKKSVPKSLMAYKMSEERGAWLGDFETAERRQIEQIYELPWEACTSLDPNSWGYNRLQTEEGYMTTKELIDYFIDVVSKGGNLLINIGPKADGTIPEVMQDRLKGIGSWLSVNGEAIYDTKPWLVFGEGPSLTEGSPKGRPGYRFKTGDVRFTTKKNIVYVIMPEWPGDDLILESLDSLNIKKMSILGSDENISWSQINGGIKVSLPSKHTLMHAYTLKLEVEGNLKK